MTRILIDKHEDMTTEGSEVQSKADTKVAAKYNPRYNRKHTPRYNPRQPVTTVSITTQPGMAEHEEMMIREGGRAYGGTRQPVMVSITTQPGMMADQQQQRAPVDVVLVLHVHIRLMAPANWHDLLIEAAGFLIDELGVDDRLAIVPTSLIKEEDPSTKQEAKRIKDAVSPKLLKMSPENKRKVSHAVKSSMAIIRRNAPLIKDLELAESALYATKSDEIMVDQRAGYIIVISNSNEDLSSLISWRFRSVHAFGFQDAHNARTMCTIASNSESTYAVFDEGGHITQAFSASIKRITSAVELLEVKLKCQQDVVLSAIAAPRISYYISYDNKCAMMWVNANLTSRDVTNFVVYLDFPKVRWSNNSSLVAAGSLIKAQVKYTNLNNLDGKPSLSIACKVLDVSKEVGAENARMEAVKIVSEITARDKSDSEQLYDAAHTLHKRWSQLVMESGKAAEEGLLSRLDAEIHEMETRLHNNYLWLEYMLSWRSHQWWPLPPLTMDKKQTTTNVVPLLKLRILAKVDGIQEPIGKNHRFLPVLIQVGAPVEGLAKVKRTPIDLVAVLDVGPASRAVNKKRLQLLNNAMEFVMTKLGRNDRLAIVTGPAGGIFPRKKKLRSEDSKLLDVVTSTKNKKHVQHKINKMLGTTCLPIPSINTSGAAGSNKLLSKSLLDAATKILDDRAEDKDRMGLIILISGTNNDTPIPSCGYTVHAFGFRDAGNAKTMYDIATANHGIYADIDDQQDRITEAFKACINNITWTIAVNAKVNIVVCNHSSDAKLVAIESGQFTANIDKEKKTGSIFAGALYASAVKRFVVYLEIKVGEEDYGGLSNLLAVDVTWQQTTVASGTTEEATQGEVQIVRDKYDDASTEFVVEEIVRREEVEIVRTIIIDTTIGGIDDVLRKVKELRDMGHKQKMRRLVSASDLRLRPKGSSSAFAVDDDSLASLQNDKDGPWFSYILSWLSFQGICEKPPAPPVKPRPEREEKSLEGEEYLSQLDEVI